MLFLENKGKTSEMKYRAVFSTPKQTCMILVKFSSKFKILVLSGHVTDDIITMKVIKMYLAWKYLPTCTLFFLHIYATSDMHLYPDSHIAPLIFTFCSVPGQSEIPHANVLQAAMPAFSVANYLRHS